MRRKWSPRVGVEEEKERVNTNSQDEGVGEGAGKLPPLQESRGARQNIKGNRLLVREVKNRPSPGHTRIAFIYVLYVLYHESVIPFWPGLACRQNGLSADWLARSLGKSATSLCSHNSTYCLIIPTSHDTIFHVAVNHLQKSILNFNSMIFISKRFCRGSPS